MGKFSKEFLFRECVLHRHCVLLRFGTPIKWDEGFVDEIFMVDMSLEGKEQEQLLLNIRQSRNTEGIIEIKAFAGQESPYNAKNVVISTCDICEAEMKSIL